MSTPKNDSITGRILTKPNKDGNLYQCEWCAHQPYKQYASYLKHTEKCKKKSIKNIEFLRLSSEDDNCIKKKKTKRCSSNKNRTMIQNNEQKILMLENEISLLRDEKNKTEQNCKLLNAKFDTLQYKNNQLLQMVENFAIEFLKTREYEF